MPKPIAPSELAASYRERDGLTFVDGFFSGDELAPMIAEAEALRSRVHRNYRPPLKKQGGVSAFDIAEHAPTIHALYRSPSFIAWLAEVTGEELLTCPESDPHACALYYYTEPGDYIGWHYDYSYYRGKRFTVLVGLVQRSESELVCRLYTRGRERATEELRVTTHPGTLVLFNGERIHHRVTPTKEGDDRVVLSLEYVTERKMGVFHRIASDLKDATLYFGFKGVCGARK